LFEDVQFSLDVFLRRIISPFLKRLVEWRIIDLARHM